MRKLIAALLGAGLLGHYAASESNVRTDPPPDDVRVLDEIIVDEEFRNLERGPRTGRLIMDARPVRPNGSSTILSHSNVELIVRPIRRIDGNEYILQENYGRRFTPIDLELGIGRARTGSRIIQARDGRRVVDLPEGLYAITEARYQVFWQIGSPLRFPSNLETYRFCMSDGAIAFEIRNGETTNLGLILVKAMERNYRKGKKEHRPILAANTPIVPVSDPQFRVRGEDVQASSTEITFDAEKSKLCGSTSIPVKGWFDREEFLKAYPKIEISPVNAVPE
ncbi:MAG: hypothetical protein AAFX02_08070 [Pseudomonadota bacterium]